MTVLKKLRSLTLAVVLSLLVVTTLPAPGPLPTELPPAGEVVGNAPYPTVACVGCIAGAVFISLGGWTSILGAAARPGSAVAAVGCVYACRAAITL